ncbi:MAG: hypothetical protein R3274_08480, partial [Desulfobacterales bacterium]|nr:hypothetical protein [Desulfobacterales bacterium]
ASNRVDHPLLHHNSIPVRPLKRGIIAARLFFSLVCSSFYLEYAVIMEDKWIIKFTNLVRWFQGRRAEHPKLHSAIMNLSVFSNRQLIGPISKIVDHAQGQGANRFESGAYTLVFEHFESVFNAAIGR